MAKHYKVLKDHPVYEAGAILYGGKNGGYSSINDLYLTKAAEKSIDNGTVFSTCGVVVEESPEWYLRVYPVTRKGKTVYLPRAEARAEAVKEEK